MGAKNLQIKRLYFFILQLLCIIAIAIISGYKTPELSDINWDGVLFLTPAGIIKNFTTKSTVMRSFYSDVSKGQGQLLPLQFLIIAELLIIEVFCFIKMLRKNPL